MPSRKLILPLLKTCVPFYKVKEKKILCEHVNLFNKNQEMKKAIVMFLLAGSVLSSSCGYYTCPTYSKAAPKKAVKEIRI